MRDCEEPLWLVITRGLPGSGKTTFAREWVGGDDENRVRVNRDDLRHNLLERYWGLTHPQEETVTVAQRAMVRALLEAGQSVVVDDTNLRAKVARGWCDLAAEVGAEFVLVEVDTDVEECVRRDHARGEAGGRLVGEEAIRGLAQRYAGPRPTIRPTPRKPGDAPERYVPREDLPTAWIVDIDGTLAKMSGRGPHDYHLVGTDAPCQPIIDLANRFAPEDQIILMSGRKGTFNEAATPEEQALAALCRQDTEDWLSRNGVEYDELHMRDAGDNRSDFIVKAEMFDANVRHRFNVLGVLDDRDQVVAMWRSIGLTCLQVAPGAF